MRRHSTRPSRRSPRALGALAVGVIALAGCESMLEVSLPGETPSEAVGDPVYAPILVSSAQGRFEDAFSNYAEDAGYIAGELIGGQSFLNTQHFRRRSLPLDGADTNGNTYNYLSQARWMAEDAYNRISDLTDAQVTNRNQLLGQAALYAGYSYTLFAEGFCSAAFDLGAEMDAPEIFALAKARFTTALTHATLAGHSETINAANVGLARVSIQLGETQAALEAARKVSSGFSKTVTRSSASVARRNLVFFNNNAGTHSIDPKYWTTTFLGVTDTRVQVVSANRIAGDGLTPLYFQRKYSGEGSPFVLASYVEAQWIIAEAMGGQAAIDIINARHAQLGLPPFAGGSAEQIKAQVIEERRREFFQDGHRLGDLRRVGGWEQWTDGVNPFVGYEYGKSRCFPLPKVERDQNPNVGPYLP